MKYTIKTLFILGLAIITTFVIAGCKRDGTNNSYVGIPNAGIVQPTGTLRGVLLDRVTNDPIVGAVVDLGVQKATTNETGGFTMHNVPATTDPAGTGGVVGKYLVTIDLRKVTSPISMATVTLPSAVKYPQFSYATVQVKYSSLNDAGNDTSGSTSTSNHDTVITGLVSSLPLEVGKLAANLSGKVAYSRSLQAATDKTWTVMLVSTSSASFCSTPSCWADMPFDSTVGHHEGIINKLTTSAGDPSFAFQNVETLTQYKIIAWDNEQTVYGEEMVMSPGDGVTKLLLIQNSDTNCLGVDCANGKADNRTVLAGPVDSIKPRIITVTPETGSDLLAATTSVVYTFSEPIKMSSYATGTTASVSNGIYYDVLVTDNGSKAGNIAHTVSWNAAGDILTVTIPTLVPSHKYTVTVAAALPKLMDSNWKTAEDPLNLALVNFTTSGSGMASAPATVVDVTQPHDWLATITLDWLPASGATRYNVYRRFVEMPGATAQNGPWDRLGDATKCYSTLVSDFTETTVQNLVKSGNTPLAVEYKVYGVNADCIESDTSAAIVSIKDEVKPAISALNTAATSSYFTSLSDSDNLIRIKVSEPLNEGSANTASNYTIESAGTVTSPGPTVDFAKLVTDTNGDGNVNGLDSPYVDLTLSKTLLSADLKQATINAGADGICNTALTGADSWRSYPAVTMLSWPGGATTILPTATIGAGKGQPYSTCVLVSNATPTSKPCDSNGDGTVTGAETTACTSLGTGDQVYNAGTVAVPVLVIISDNSGVCHTLAVTGGTDTQKIAVNNGQPNAVCMDAGANLILNSLPLSGDDTAVRYSLVTFGAAITDVAGNVMKTGAKTITTDGFVQ